MDTADFINKGFTYAIVGASNNPDKYGHKVMADLQQAGFKVVPINPKEHRILDEQVYANLAEYPDPIDVVIFVVPPNATRKVLEDVAVLDIRKVWMQPGSESDESIAFCEDHGIDCVHDACIMLSH